jgi:hypothetical protein
VFASLPLPLTARLLLLLCLILTLKLLCMCGQDRCKATPAEPSTLGVLRCSCS